MQNLQRGSLQLQLSSGFWLHGEQLLPLWLEHRLIVAVIKRSQVWIYVKQLLPVALWTCEGRGAATLTSAGCWAATQDRMTGPNPETEQTVKHEVRFLI